MIIHRCYDKKQTKTLRKTEVLMLGGEGGIRTLGSFYTTPVFKTGTINHSVTSPCGRKLS